MSIFVPQGLRPPGLYPAEPRVIYKTKRKNLTHEGRIGRVDRLETLNAFRAFSHAFHAHHPRLAPDLGGYLHNHGFLPDKGALFGLSPEQIDPEDPEAHSVYLGQYLTDFQARILPLANGRYAAAGSNRLFLWRLHNQVLPLVPLAGSLQYGRALSHALPQGSILSRPVETTARFGPDWCPDLPLGHVAPQDGSADCVFLDMPGDLETDGVKVIRMAVIYDPQSNLPVVLGACQLEGPLAALDAQGQSVACRRIDPESGMGGPLRRFVRGAIAPAEIEDKAPRAVPGWWPALTAVLTGLRRLPIWAVMQLDLVETDQGPLVVDMTDQLDVAALQLEGPIMGSQAAISFIKEFGV